MRRSRISSLTRRLLASSGPFPFLFGHDSNSRMKLASLSGKAVGSYFDPGCHFSTRINEPRWVIIEFSAVTIMLQALLWLSTVWSCRCRCLFECVKSENIYNSTLLRVKPMPHNGDEELVKIRKKRKPNSPRPQIWFQFQKVKILIIIDLKHSFLTLNPILQPILHPIHFGDHFKN